MNHQLHKLCIVLVVCALAFNSCSDDDEPANGLTDDEKQTIKDSYDEFADALGLALLAENPHESFETLLPVIQNDPGVEEAWLTENALYVKYKKGGVVSWYITPDLLIPPWAEAGGDNVPDQSPARLEGVTFEKTTQLTELVGNERACLINQQFNDEGRDYCRRIINNLDSDLRRVGFDVDVVNGADADIDFHATDLKDYGVIFNINHGSFDGVNTWIMTGEEPGAPHPVDELLDERLQDWRDGRLALYYVIERRGGQVLPVCYYSVSDKFIAKAYETGDFPNSLIYLVACQGMQSTNLAEALHADGASVVIGWNETNCLGQASGESLFCMLLTGTSVQKALEGLPAEALTDFCDVKEGANLVYYPGQVVRHKSFRRRFGKLFSHLP